MQTLGQLTQGTVINYNNPVVAMDVNYVVLRHYTDKFGNYTEVVNLETYEKEEYTQHTEVSNRWSVVKEN